MKENARQPENLSRTFDRPARAFAQSQLNGVLQAYKRRYRLSRNEQPEGTRISVTNTQSRHTVQMVRKRVRGAEPEITPDNLFYDKNDGKYYSGMQQIEESAEKTIDPDENALYNNLSGKIRSEHTTLLAETTPDETFMLAPTENGDSFTGQVYSSGAEVTSPPPAVRLYAEGNMNHASALAENMNDVDSYQSFLALDKQPHPPVSGAPLIKATEFESRNDVLARYFQGPRYQPPANFSSKEKYHAAYMGGINKAKEDLQKNPPEAEFQNLNVGEYPANATTAKQKGEVDGYIDRYYYDNVNGWSTFEGALKAKEQKDSLEVSYAGKTGNITSPVTDKGRPKRQYDLIQATFFWIPAVNSQVNANALTLFLRNKHAKLKENGLIRIVLANKNMGKDQMRLDNNNNYRLVAENIRGNEELGVLYDLTLPKLDGTYSTALAALNPGESFKHTRTEIDETVTDTDGAGDLIIEGVKKEIEESETM